jgi:hypothetical protein
MKFWAEHYVIPTVQLNGSRLILPWGGARYRRDKMWYHEFVLYDQDQQFSVITLARLIRDEFSSWTLGRRGVTGVFDPF